MLFRSEVTGIVSLRDRVLAVGWARTIKAFHQVEGVSISEAPVDVPHDETWREMEGHKDDITAIDCYRGSLLATGSYDGGVVVCNIRFV